LLLADISGFDAYLADVELEHAQDVMAELLELMMASLAPPMHIAGIHRDAIMAYESEQSLTRGETLLELTEATYVAFRDRLKSIERNNTCTCRACMAIPSLDLKFLIHFGEYTAKPGENGQVALGGLDVDLVRRRLLKEQISDDARSYALFTHASLERMDVQPEGMEEGCGEYPHLGEVRTGSLDLGHRYQTLTETRQAYVTAEQADILISHDYATTPPVVWDWLNDPNKRTRWLRWTKWKPGIRPGGRTGVGAVNHCSHGVGSVIETVLEWRPYHHYTVEMKQASLWSSVMATYRLELLPDGGGTRVHMHGRLQEAPAMPVARPLFSAILSRKMKQDFVNMGRLMAEELLSRESLSPAGSQVTHVP
jgi:uncharacterized protein YndB with AHSA1/START domain